jgi:hypothetical protein
VQQEILAAHRAAPLRVYAVWFNNFEGDDRELWEPSLLHDARVTHYWDQKKQLGRWYANALTRPQAPEYVEWDAFFVYAPGDTWSESATRPIRWGRTIVGKREDLRAAVAGLLN